MRYRLDSFRNLFLIIKFYLEFRVYSLRYLYKFNKNKLSYEVIIILHPCIIYNIIRNIICIKIIINK